jgi:cytochrome c biogenesis protein CcdA/thiol-disulfide isomerase/thioredoxin
MDGRFLILLPIAFAAGIVTAVSPCVFPVLPILFAGGASGGRRRPYAIIAGLVTSFATFTLIATWLLRQLHLPQDFLRNLSIGLLFLVAASLIFPKVGVWIERPLARLSRRAPNSDLGGGFLLGASLGLVFVPCGGPIIGAISANAARVHLGWQTVAITLAYALGAALPMLAIAALGQRATRRIRMNAQALRTGLGIVLALAALALVFNADTKLQTWFPDYTHALQGVERSSIAQDELAKLQHQGKSRFHGPESAGSLTDYGTAPDFTGISEWINSKPLALQQLRGKVVLVDFWTYSCINCLRTLPHLEAWDKRYRNAGLVIVGVHTPEFAFEHVPSNVREAARKLGVRYPVAIDDDYRTWSAYQNDAWPAEYLIDKRGHVREIKKGEGQYAETESSIRTLLGEPAGAQLASVKDRTPQHLTTPESYLGWERLDRYVGSPLTANVPMRYRFPREIPLNDLAYSGVWSVQRQRIVAHQNARLRLHFLAQNVYLVLSGHGRMQVIVGGRPVKTIRVNGLSRLYMLLQYRDLAEGALELRFTPGIAAYAFTFG